MNRVSRLRETRRRCQRTKLVSLNGVAVIVLFVSLAVAGAFALAEGSLIQALTLYALLAVAVSIFRVTAHDDRYDRYLAATDVLKEMSELVMELESEGIPIEGKHGEDFYRLFTAAQGRASKGSRLTREDMDFVALNTALAHTALESHAAVESVEEN